MWGTARLIYFLHPPGVGQSSVTLALGPVARHAHFFASFGKLFLGGGDGEGEMRSTFDSGLPRNRRHEKTPRNSGGGGSRCQDLMEIAE